jgi:hypothetical protein
MGLEMVPVPGMRIAAAIVERVADHAAPAGIRAVDPEIEFPVLDVAVEIEIGDTRLDKDISVALVDLEDAVHALEIEDNAPREDRCSTAITQILAGRDRIDRDAFLIGDAHHRLDFLCADRRDRSGGEPLFRFVPEDGIGVAMGLQVLVRGEDPVSTHHGPEARQRGGEISGAHARRRSHALAPRFGTINQLTSSDGCSAGRGTSR